MNENECRLFIVMKYLYRPRISLIIRNNNIALVITNWLIHWVITSSFKIILKCNLMNEEAISFLFRNIAKEHFLQYDRPIHLLMHSLR